METIYYCYNFSILYFSYDNETGCQNLCSNLLYIYIYNKICFKSKSMRQFMKLTQVKILDKISCP